MITGELKSKVDRVWDAFWSGGISNPLEVIEQITYLLFIRRLDDLTILAEKKAQRTGRTEKLIFGPDQQDLRWSVFKNQEPAWSRLSAEAAREVGENLAGLPSGITDADEDAKRFDLLILRRQLAQLQGETGAAEHLRETVQQIAAALVDKTTIPSVAAQHVLLEEVASDQWWVDVTLPMLEVARRRLRGLLRFIDPTRKDPIYTSFQDELTDPTFITLPAFTPGTDMVRFRARAAAYLKAHEDHMALQRLRRNKALTPEDLDALEQMLIDSGAGDEHAIAKAREDSQGLGLFIRSLVGLDHHAALEAFADYLDGNRFSTNQIHFVNLIVDELTTNGVMEPARLYESPFTDLAATGPEAMFPDADVDNIVDILNTVRANAQPAEGVA